MDETHTPELADQVRRRLRRAYDGAVDARDRRSAPEWENAQRDSFVRLLLAEKKRSVLELGAATGTDSVFFRSHGLSVASTDLSPAMARRCHEKGLDACAMDANRLAFRPDSFDAVYARNCLVHLPASELCQSLQGIRQVLRPGGLCHIALYGGRKYEGVWQEDSWEPKRFFSFHTDDQLEELFSSFFEVLSFDRTFSGWDGLHYQAFLLENTPSPDTGR